MKQYYWRMIKKEGYCFDKSMDEANQFKRKLAPNDSDVFE